MNRDYAILIASSIFVALICIEIVHFFLSKNRSYTFKESISNLTMGLGQQAIETLFIAGMIAIYQYTQQNFALFSWEVASVFHWILIVLLVDLAFYFAHCAGHRVNIFVATHAPHHQSTDYNLASALRQSWTGRLGSFPFFLVLAFLGVPLLNLLLAQVGVLIVQFLSHTGATRKTFGFLEHIWVTPSNHRVHHGVNARYLDKNYGGILIIWDRLFGSYAKETNEEIIIGFKSKVNYYSPLEANTNYYKRILFVMRKRKGWVNKLTLLFQSPETLYQDLKKFNYKEKAKKNTIEHLNNYEIFSTLTLLSIAIYAQFYFLSHVSQFTYMEKLSYVFFIILLVSLIGKIINHNTVLAASSSRAFKIKTKKIS